jgi:hypothetical protein
MRKFQRVQPQHQLTGCRLPKTFFARVRQEPDEEQGREPQGFRYQRCGGGRRVIRKSLGVN